jgi:hypothetical protein
VDCFALGTFFDLPLILHDLACQFRRFYALFLTNRGQQAGYLAKTGPTTVYFSEPFVTGLRGSTVGGGQCECQHVIEQKVTKVTKKICD